MDLRRRPPALGGANQNAVRRPLHVTVNRQDFQTPETVIERRQHLGGISQVQIPSTARPAPAGRRDHLFVHSCRNLELTIFYHATVIEKGWNELGLDCLLHCGC